MRQSVSDYLVQRLLQWGVRRVYGYPGDGINGVIGAIQRANGKIEYLQPQNEEMGAFMACAHAKFTGQLGVCLATSGPGALHLLNGLYDAKLDHQSVLALVGQQSRRSLGSDFQQEVDLTTLFKDVSRFCELIATPVQARHLLDRAIRVALSERSVATLIIPNDIQEETAVAPSRSHGYSFSGAGFHPPVTVPAERDLFDAAAILNAGEKVAILVGAGALGATDEVLAVADALGAGIAKALLGKAVIPDSIPYCTGSLGILGTKPSWEMMQECDTLLMIGSNFPYAEFLPKEGTARGVQIDIEARNLSLRYPMELPLVGDSAETLRLLHPLLRRKKDRHWRHQIEAQVSAWWRLLEKRAMQPANPINPQRLFWELSPKLPENVILSADSGTSAVWFARDLKIRRGMMASLSGNLASMGAGVPYAIAAKFAFPNRPAIAFVGDGAMLMNGLNELTTIERHWREWSDPRLIVLVLANRDLNMVTWEQRAASGNAKYDRSQPLSDYPFARYAELIGLQGIRIDHPEQISLAWEEALMASRPVVIEALCDPEVPVLPPHITLKEARNFVSAVSSGDSGSRGMIRGSFLEAIQSFVTSQR